MTCQGVANSCQLSHGVDLGTSLGSCFMQGWDTRVLTAERGGMAAEPREQLGAFQAGCISTAALRGQVPGKHLLLHLQLPAR